MLPSLCPDSQLWLRDAQSDLHLGELWKWPDPKTCDWGRCYCALEMEWPLSCTDSKGPGAKRQQWRSAAISISAGISRERRWLEPNRSVWSASCLPSELIVSIDPLSPLHKHQTLLHNQKVHRPGIDERSRRWAVVPNQCPVCSRQWRLVVRENRHLWASVTMCGLIWRPHSLVKIVSRHECRQRKKNIEKLKRFPFPMFPIVSSGRIQSTFLTYNFLWGLDVSAFAFLMKCETIQISNLARPCCRAPLESVFSRSYFSITIQRRFSLDKTRK